jgi:hypothetical protein
LGVLGAHPVRLDGSEAGATWNAATRNVLDAERRGGGQQFDVRFTAPMCLAASTDVATWTVGAQRFRTAVTLFDAFVRDDVVKSYRVLGTVVEDGGDADAEPSSPRSADEMR